MLEVCRSYGDSANAKLIIETDKISRIINFNDESGIIRVEAGATIKRFLKLIVPHGWFLTVTSGTNKVTIGGNFQ